mgnify:CR=1 FL=1
MNIGSYTLPSKVLLAPMAGTSDKPFRIICKEQGAALTTSEMVVMKKHLLNTNKSKSEAFNAQMLFAGKPEKIYGGTDASGKYVTYTGFSKDISPEL